VDLSCSDLETLPEKLINTSHLPRQKRRDKGVPNVCMKLEETLIPVQETVQRACEKLGLDPLYVANEGRFAVFVPPAQVDAALEVMRKVRCRGGRSALEKWKKVPAAP
jgi:AIR synthase related protein